MKTKHLSGDYPGGYTLAKGYGKLVIDQGAYVGGNGVQAPFSATVVNEGDVQGSAVGVYLQAGGSLINGSATKTGASISGQEVGVRALGVATLANFGTITGVALRKGGSLVNGSRDDITALIQGAYGVSAGATVTITNFGTIAGGVSLQGGHLTNGSTDDTTALISAQSGQLAVAAQREATTIANFGTIAGSGYGGGVFIAKGGSVTNGSSDDTIALITGYYGMEVIGPVVTTIGNFGTIDATGKGTYGDGVVLYSAAGISITNGSLQDTRALIEGYTGVYAKAGSAGDTVVNFGTIEGLGGVSVEADEVIAEAGSTFIGTIEGGDLVLAGGGSGTISNLGGVGTLTGAVEAEFNTPGDLLIEAGGTWTLAGSNKVNAATVLVDDATLINGGALTISGSLSIGATGVFTLAGGAITSFGPAARILDQGLMESVGAGLTSVAAMTQVSHHGVVEVAVGVLDFTLRLRGTGVLKIDAGATLEADAGAASPLNVAFDGAAATLALKRPRAFLATLTGFSAGDIIDLLAVEATGASVNGSDQLVIVDGSKTVASLQLSGNYAGATFTTGSDGHGGTNVMLTAGGPTMPSVAGMASAMAAFAAPAGVAALGRGLRAEVAPMIARPNVRLL